MEIGNYDAQKPTLEHLLGYESCTLSIFLRGHLFFEAVLNNIIHVKDHLSEAKINRLTCAKKIDRVLALELISQEMHEFLTEVNKLRNKFAHRLGYDMTEEDVHELIRLAGKLPEIDFTDDMHLLDRATLYEWYTDTTGVLEEMFKHAAMDLSFISYEHGGEAMFED